MACVQRPRHVWQRPWPTLACFAMSLASHIKGKPPTFCLISCKAKGVSLYIYICGYLWHACNVLGMFGNVLGRPWHALQCPRHTWQRPWRPTSKETPHFLPYKL